MYGEGVYQNERADLVGLAYIEYSLSRIKESIEWLKNSEDVCQYFLAELDMLAYLGKKFPKDINLKLKRSEVSTWKEVFFSWYDKNYKAIPPKYRNSIKDNAVLLFDEINEYGHSIASVDWAFSPVFLYLH